MKRSIINYFKLHASTLHVLSSSLIRSKVLNQDDVINSPIIMSVTLPSLARLSARNEHVLEVLVCQSGHLHPPGLGWSPSHSGGWHKLAPAVQIQPVCIVRTLQ